MNPIVSSLLVVAVFAVLVACRTPRRTTEPRPYIAQREADGLFAYRIDGNQDVIHESALRFKDAGACLDGYNRFRAMLENGVEPIIRTDSNRATLERWHVEDSRGGTVDNAEQGFATPSAALRNFKTVKRIIIAHEDPLVRLDVLIGSP